MSTYAIKADKFFLPAGPQLGGYLMVEDGVFGAWQADEPSCEIKDYTGSWIAPGMVDTHIHGFYNHSTTDNDPEGIDISSTERARRGTTSWLPTTFTDGVEQNKDACAAIAREVRDGKISGDRVTEKMIADHLYNPDIPDCDLVIRTSGEQRTSNFLPCEAASAELDFVPELFPDCGRDVLWRSIDHYIHRDRRFGGVI